MNDCGATSMKKETASVQTKDIDQSGAVLNG